MTQPVQGETPEPALEGVTPEAPAPEQHADPTAELEKVRLALKQANKEAAERRKKLEAYEKADAERKQAEMSEMDRLKAQYEAANAKAAKLERDSLQRQAAEAAGLPSAFAARLTGDTLEAMTEDAKGLLAAMPKPGAPKNLSPGNPQGGNQAETDAARLARYGMR